MMDKIMGGVNTLAEKGLPMLMQMFQTGMQNQQQGGQSEYAPTTNPMEVKW